MTEKLYRTVKLRFIFAMLHSRTRHRDGVTYGNLWFARALGFSSIKCILIARPNSDRCMAHEEDSCEPCQFSMEDQYVFVQYYEILEEDGLAKYDINQKLNYIRLKWECRCEDDDRR